MVKFKKGGRKEIKKTWLVIVIILVVTGLVMGGLMLSKKSKQVSLEQITLRIGYTEIKPGPEVALKVKAAVEKNNQEVRLEGLEDDLNPEILSLAKVEAFLQGLSKLSEETLSELKNKVLYLNAPTLNLGTATAVTVEILNQGYSLVIPKAEGELVQSVLKAAIDKARAQDLVQRARPAAAAFNQKVEKLESTLDRDSASALGQLSLARSQRFAVSIVWKNNSLALLETEPANEIFKADAEKAKKAAAKYVAPPWTGMPSPEEL